MQYALLYDTMHLSRKQLHFWDIENVVTVD